MQASDRESDENLRGGPRLGFIGTGNLGSPMAVRLLAAGYEVVVHDADRDAATACIAAGARWARSPAEVAACAETVITCLPRVDIVGEVVAGANGVLSSLGSGGCWIDMSTNDAGEICRLGSIADSLGVDTLEAPVTGGVHRAAAGELTVLVGGPEATYVRQQRVLGSIGSKVIYLGALGQASKMKVITNMLAFVHLVAAGEALMLAARAGIDLRDAFESVKASSGNSFVHETESQVILAGTYDIGFTLDLACKDLSLVHRLADDVGVPAEIASFVEQRFLAARARYGGDAWSPHVVQLLEDEVGMALRSPGFPGSLLPGLDGVEARGRGKDRREGAA